MSWIHGNSRTKKGKKAHGATSHKKPGMHGKLRGGAHMVLPYTAKKDVWKGQGVNRNGHFKV